MENIKKEIKRIHLVPGNDIDVVVHCFFTVIQPVRYLRCLSFSEYIILDIHLEQTIR